MLSSLLLPLAVSVAVSAVEPAAASAQLSIPHEKYILESNGLEVILSRDPSLPIVAVNIWYHAGPINESPKRTGFAHLFEHLMFQGSQHVGDDLHFQYLTAAGASLINGTTDFDRTNYFATVPSNQLELVLWLESDRMGFLKPTISQAKLDEQREVVKNERRQSVENRHYGMSEEKINQMMFPTDHPYYGNVIGSMSDLSAASLQDVHDFYDQYYAPANATLAIVGDIDIAKTKELVAKYFGSLPRRSAPAGRAVETPALAQETRAVVKEPVQLPRVSYGFLSPSAFSPGDADADVLAFILGQGKSSRLYQKLVYELEMAQDVDAGQESQSLASIFMVGVTGRPGVAREKIEAETQKIFEELRKNPPSDREVLRAKNQLKTMMVLGLQNIGGFGGKADMLNRYNQYVKDPDFFAKDLARYEAVTPASVFAMAKNLLDPTKRVVVVTEVQ